MAQQRAVDLADGVAMVVTDLHGSWDTYCRLRDVFLEKLRKREVDYLVLCGDMIHAEGLDEYDASLEIIQDIMALKADIGKQKVILLLGNHELPHIYGLSLAKGPMEFTPRFEAALSRLDQRHKPIGRRADGTAETDSGLDSTTRKGIVKFLSTLPFFVRTKAGVMLTHAGASADVSSPRQADRLLNIQHEELVTSADRELAKFDVNSLRRGYSHFTGIPYDEQARKYLAVSGSTDSRYNDLLRVLFLNGQNTEFDLMWNTLFSQNELDIGETTYQRVLKSFLQNITEVSPQLFEQRVLVAGHISVRDGYAEVGKQQLRLASYTHAFPKRSARYLLLDCEKPVYEAGELVQHLRFVFDDFQLSTSAATGQTGQLRPLPQAQTRNLDSSRVVTGTLRPPIEAQRPPDAGSQPFTRPLGGQSR